MIKPSLKSLAQQHPCLAGCFALAFQQCVTPSLSMAVPAGCSAALCLTGAAPSVPQLGQPGGAADCATALRTQQESHALIMRAGPKQFRYATKAIQAPTLVHHPAAGCSALKPHMWVAPLDAALCTPWLEQVEANCFYFYFDGS